MPYSLAKSIFTVQLPSRAKISNCKMCKIHFLEGCLLLFLVYGNIVSFAHENPEYKDGDPVFSIISQVNEKFLVSDQTFMDMYPVQEASGLQERNILLHRKAGICQIHLNFIEMSLAPPATSATGSNAGNCLTEHLTIHESSTLTDPLQVCGYMTGQHMYLAFRGDKPISIKMSTLKASRFTIGVTQISCHSTTVECADSCLQYFDGSNNATGTIKSFNFREGSDTSLQLNNQRYQICLKRAPGKSTVTFKSCTANASQPMPFFISGLSTPSAALEGTNCPADKDYILISGTRYCGNNFAQQTQQMSNVMSLFVNFNGEEMSDRLKVGFPIGVSAAQCQMLHQNGFSNCVRDTTGYVCTCDQTYGNLVIPSGVYNSIPQTYCQSHMSIIPGYEKCVWITASAGNHCLCKRIIPRDVDNRGFCLTYSQS